MPDFGDAIFFWESVGDPPQLVDQYLTCLRNAGFFDQVKGMVIGSFIEQDSAEHRRRDPFEMVLDVLTGLDFPVLYSPTFGHLPILENPILPIGALCELNSGTHTLSLLEDVVV
jgi:muramoyltetrapeptide carboxypeptidase LdcA involved in peptidoglycan recycling